jgi:hypothetical protein
MMLLKEAKCVGACLPREGSAAFDDAHAVATDGNRWVIAKRYVQGSVDGDLLLEDGWKALLFDGQAVEFLEPFALPMSARVWAFRETFEKRQSALDDLRASGALLHSVIHLQSPRGILSELCIVEPLQARELRKLWASDALDRALVSAQEGAWGKALANAQQLFELESELDERAMALLVVTLEQSDRKQRAAGIRKVALRSRGAAFAEELDRYVVSFREKLVPATRSVSPWKAIRKQHLADGRGGLGSQEAA